MSTDSQSQLVETKSMGAIALPVPKNKGAELVMKHREQIISTMPQATPQDQSRFLISALVSANALSSDKPCDPATVAKSVFNAAVAGVLLGEPFKLAYLVPYWSNKRRTTECQLIFGYQGYLHMAFGCDFLREVHAEVVLKGEKFERWVDADGPNFRHDIPPERVESKDLVIGAYCVFKNQKGGRGFQYVPRSKLNEVDTGKNVWASDPIPMMKKSPIRRAAKLWQLTPALALAVHIEEQAERDEQQFSELRIDSQSAGDLPAPSYDDYDETDEERESALERAAIQAEQQQYQEQN